MSQVNFLSADVGQTPDKQGAKGDSSIKNQAKTQAFSDAMEQHYPRKTVAESDNKNKQGGNLTSKAADQQQQLISKDSALKPFKGNQAGDTQALPLPANDASLSAKNDNSQNSSMPFPIDNESQLAANKTVNDDADKLPVPLPIDDKSLVTSPKEGDGFIVPITVAANGEQLITGAKSKDSEHTLPVPLPVTPLEAEIRAIEKAGGAFNGDPKASNNQSNSYVGAQTQTVNNAASHVEKDDAVDLLKMLQGSQQLLTKSAAENTSVELQGKITAAVDESILANNKNVMLSEQAKNLTAEQNVLAKNVKGEQVTVLANANNTQQNKLLAAGEASAKQLSEITAETVAGGLVKNVASSTLKNSAESSALNTAQNVVNTPDALNAKQIASSVESANLLASEQGGVDEADLIAEQARIQALAQEANAADKNQVAKQEAKQETQQVTRQEASNRELLSSAADKDSVLDLAQAKKVSAPELIAEQNTVHKAVVSESNEVKVQTAELKQVNVADSKRANDNEPAQTRTVNQSTAAAISASTAEPKVDANQKPEANEVVDKLSSAKVDEQKLAKTEGEKLAPQVDKIASAFNQTLDAMATRPVASSAELAAQQTQNFESTINHLTTNTVQSQKSITALNTETIAIYRKDFADAVKDKVMVMINQKIQQVEIQLDPPEMGNIHVRVNLQNEQAAVQFVVQNQQAKEALEQNMGKLRDMLAESGVDVGDANIEQREAKEQKGNDFGQQANKGQNGEATEDNVSANDNSMHNVVKASSSGVDYYA